MNISVDGYCWNPIIPPGGVLAGGPPPRTAHSPHPVVFFEPAVFVCKLFFDIITMIAMTEMDDAIFSGDPGQGQRPS